jgi:hypothetical protein
MEKSGFRNDVLMLLIFNLLNTEFTLKLKQNPDEFARNRSVFKKQLLFDCLLQVSNFNDHIEGFVLNF